MQVIRCLKLSEAMETFGGMSALYDLKDDPKNKQAFKDLYDPKVKALKFGDNDYGFEIFKDDLAKEIYSEDISAMEAMGKYNQAVKAINHALK